MATEEGVLGPVGTMRGVSINLILNTLARTAEVVDASNTARLGVACGTDGHALHLLIFS